MTGNSTETAELFFSGISFAYASHALIKSFEQSLLPGGSSQQPGKYILPICFNLSHAIECYLKSFLHYKGVPMQTLKSREWGHNLEFLHDRAIERDLYKIIDPDTQEDISYINDETKNFLRKMIEALGDLHNNSSDFANRYFKSNGVFGYSSFSSESLNYFEKVRALLQTQGLNHPNRHFIF